MSNKPSCAFIYSVPNKGNLDRVIRKLSITLQRVKIPISAIDRKPHNVEWMPNHSPYSITKHVYEALSSEYDTKLYHLTEQRVCLLSEGSILIGHPYFPNDGTKKGALERSLGAYKNSRIKKIIISPLHCNTNVTTGHINKHYLDHIDSIIEYADKLIAIQGEYWWDEWDNSPYAHWKHKMERLDMAVDVSAYPYLRRRFNKKGARKFLYIGKNDPMKGTGYLSCIAKENKSVHFAWIGHGDEIENVFKISNERRLDPVYMQKVVDEYDFFISTSVADPNPTTILECMAWGLPVVCSRQSGYYESDYIHSIDIDNIKSASKQIEQLQEMDEDKLLKWSNNARSVVENKYSFDSFTNRVTSIIKNTSEK